MTPNPFSQSPQYWRSTFCVPAAQAMVLSDIWDDIALSAACVEIEETPEWWMIELVFNHAPDTALIMQRVKVLAHELGFSMPDIVVEAMPREDWLARVARQFPPLRVGRYFVHGAHVQEKAPAATIGIQVEAGAAFGSGEHSTTKGCLLAYDRLSKHTKFQNILDIGTGSAILAIAAAKSAKNVQMLATDIDPVAVQVAKENARLNGVGQQIETLCANGTNAPGIQRNAPYDLIFANILARPLVKLAPDIAKLLEPGGYAILSGLLVSQATMVHYAYQAQGLKKRLQWSEGPWCALVFQKGTA